MEGSKSFTIDVIEDKDANVLVGTSDDIPGLTLEAESMGHLYDAIMEIVPHLVKSNLGIGKDTDLNIKLRLHGSSPLEHEQVPRLSLEKEYA